MPTIPTARELAMEIAELITPSTQESTFVATVASKIQALIDAVRIDERGKMLAGPSDARELLRQIRLHTSPDPIEEQEDDAIALICAFALSVRRKTLEDAAKLIGEMVEQARRMSAGGDAIAYLRCLDLIAKLGPEVQDGG